MAVKNISNQELKGTKDWFPEEFNIRKYIFDKWREVCLSYGFFEYLSPLLENADIYRAKSGEDVGNKELMIFVDQGGRELAIRPEMTPSVVRMVSKIYQTSPKPIKLFSIANFFRNEKPQRGRNREFWQLNCDIFGSDSPLSDLEILQMSVDLVLAFNPPKDSFVLKINHRGLIDFLFDSIKIKKEQKIMLLRLMDKYNKMSADNFILALKDLKLKDEQIDQVIKFISSKNLDDLVDKIPNLKNSEAFSSLIKIIDEFIEMFYGEYIMFSPDIIRGFDYYDGLVFELFDKHPDNNRAMFGGGRYNGLADVFGVNNFPAIGFAPGDETFKLFLEAWGLLPKVNLRKDVYFLPLLADSLKSEIISLAKKLRVEGKKVELGFDVVKISRALEQADKNGFGHVVILGEEELKKGEYKVKDMVSGVEENFKL
ncbi:MAG: histidine--tRNA ligase [Patescibacteria group bacterium]|nr:histidine--tRNA ligase [Patescibacteria group bacterium]